MTRYDPEHAPDPERWLDADEDERITAVREFHEPDQMPLPHARLHAAIHVTIENQLAMGEPVVVDALERLRAEGLSRHDALHAIGWVLAEHLVTVLQPDFKPPTDPHVVYFERLKHLTALEWLQSVENGDDDE